MSWIDVMLSITYSFKIWPIVITHAEIYAKIGIYCQQNTTKWFNKAYVAYTSIIISKRYK